MEQVETTSRQIDWLGLQHLAAALQAVDRDTVGATRDVIDRLDRTLEIVDLVEERADVVRAQARSGSTHETMQLAADLRRLANRIESIGAFLLDLGNNVIELEDQVLVELDDRIRRQGDAGPADHAPRAIIGWAAAHAA